MGTTEIFRQAARSMIVRNAQRIVGGEAPFRNRNEASVELGRRPDLINDPCTARRRRTSRARSSSSRRTHPEAVRARPDARRAARADEEGPCGLDVNQKLQVAPSTVEGAGRDPRHARRRSRDPDAQQLRPRGDERRGRRSPTGRGSSRWSIDFGDDRRVEVLKSRLHTFMLAYAISVRTALQACRHPP